MKKCENVHYMSTATGCLQEEISSISKDNLFRKEYNFAVNQIDSANHILVFF